jgi:fatty acid desaturase
MGGEWILSPLMANHNYHLIHHLYPTAPFYNYIKIMKLCGDEILAKEPLMPPSFGLSPRTKGVAKH